MADLEQSNWKPERELVSDLLEKVGIPVGPFMRYAESVRERRAQRLARLLSEAESKSGLTANELLRLFADNGQLCDLLADVLEAASGSRSEERIRGLARVLTNAAANADEAAVDDLHEVVRALGRLEPIDIRSLHALEETGPREQNEELDEARDVIARELGSPVLASPVEKKLYDLALINSGVPYDKDERRRHLVTPFGRRVLCYLSQLGHE